jgi:signal transduction histidine kinase/CheY-like chemotaxis protein
MQEAITSAVTQGWPFCVDHRLVRPDGSVREVQCRGRVVSDESGTVLSLLGSSQDITDRRQLEDQLRQALKMEAVGRLAGGIAHDFNNLLTVIKSNAYFLLEDLDAADPRREDAAQIQTAASRAADLTRQLLAFSRKQILNPRLLDLNATVAAVAAMLGRVIGEDIELAMEVAPGELPVMADPGQLEQVIINLAVNARDAMPEGGTVTLRTAVPLAGADAGLVRAGLPLGRYVSLTVEDTGRGIDADILPRIFEPFYSTKEGKGTGLGLATVYGIVEQSGGRIIVESEPGRGSRFTVFLPRQEEAHPVAQPTGAAKLPRGTERILVVEDEAQVRGTITRMLKRLGYTVIGAEGGAEALGMVETSTKRIDLVLTDVVMADVNGRLLGECINSQDPHVRMLYMSGYTDDDMLRRGLLKPGSAMLQKPFTMEALARAVRETLDTPATT